MPIPGHYEGSAVGVTELHRDGEVVEAELEQLGRAEMAEVVESDWWDPGVRSLDADAGGIANGLPVVIEGSGR